MLHGIADWQRIMSFLGLVASFGLLVKLRLNGLLRVYRWFSVYLFYCSFAGALLLIVPVHSNKYAVIWICVKPVEWLLCLAVVLEIYSLVLHRYPGIASLTHWAIIAGVIVSLLLSMGSLGWDFQNPHEKFPLLRGAFAVQRTIDNIMVWSLLMPWLLMARFPIRLCRNVLVHAFLFSTCVALEAGALFLRNLLGNSWNPWTNLAMTVGTVVCLLGWIVFLRRTGEKTEEIVLARVDPEREQALIEQLKEFNRLVLRAST